MKNSIFFLTLSFLASFLNLTACQPQATLIEMPQEMQCNIVMQKLQLADVSALKQACKMLNDSFGYWMLNREIIEKVDETMCTKAIYSFARTKQTNNFSYFFNNNNKEKRKNALVLLGWYTNDCEDEQLMQAHCIGTPLVKIIDWTPLFKNSIAFSMICFSDKTNIQNKDGDTALIWASINGCSEVVRLFLAHPHIDVNIQDEHGETALTSACLWNRTAIVKLFLAHQHIKVNIQNTDGFTALIWASDCGYTEIVKLLFAHPEIDVNMQNEKGSTALIRASMQRRVEVVKLLLAHPEIDVNIQNKKGLTALIWASIKGHAEVVKLIKEKLAT